jgi:diketogulonate reductase-like aldo/keto reductase
VACWLTVEVARGSSVLAKSVTPARIKANMELVQLDASDMKTIDGYSNELRQSGKFVRYVYPEFGVDFGLVHNLISSILLLVIRATA